MNSCKGFPIFREGQVNKQTLDARGNSFRDDDASASEGPPRRRASWLGTASGGPDCSCISFGGRGCSLLPPGSPGFELFTGKSGAEQIPRWYMSITMIFGSMLAGRRAKVAPPWHSPS